MTKIINLNKVRKAREKARKRDAADENAIRHGRSRAEKDAEKARSDKAAKTLDDHRRDTE